jgi:hypothetical protein
MVDESTTVKIGVSLNLPVAVRWVVTGWMGGRDGQPRVALSLWRQQQQQQQQTGGMTPIIAPPPPLAPLSHLRMVLTPGWGEGNPGPRSGSSMMAANSWIVAPRASQSSKPEMAVPPIHTQRPPPPPPPLSCESGTASTT